MCMSRAQTAGGYDKLEVPTNSHDGAREIGSSFADHVVAGAQLRLDRQCKGEFESGEKAMSESRRASDGLSAEWVVEKTCCILLKGEGLHTVHIKET